jgi:anti-anti-sigma factor
VSTYAIEVGEDASLDAVVVTLTGELDLTNAHELEERFEAFDPGLELVVELAGVSFLDSAALHVLFRVARRHAGRVTFVVDPISSIARTLEIVRLGDAATIVSARDQIRPRPA